MPAVKYKCGAEGATFAGVIACYSR